MFELFDPYSFDLCFVFIQEKKYLSKLKMSFKINDGHWNVLLSFMDKHPSFARGQFSGPTGKVIQKKLWEQLSSELNSLGYGTKSVEKWQKTWSDMKYGIKRKASTNKLSLDETGGGPGNYKKLNDFEQRILSILGKSFYEGVGSKECGLQEHHSLSKLDKIELQHMEIAPGDKGLPSTLSQYNMEIPKIKLTVRNILGNNEIAECSKQAQRESAIVPNTVDYYTDHTPRNKLQSPLPSHDNMEIPKNKVTVGDNEIAGYSKESTIVPNIGDHNYTDKTPRKKIKLSREEIEDSLYKETISELKSIKEGVFAIGTNLSLINDTLQEIKTTLRKD